MTDQINSFGIAPISELKNKKVGDAFKEYFKRIFTYDWVFSTWYEKLIILVIMIWFLQDIYKIIAGAIA